MFLSFSQLLIICSQNPPEIGELIGIPNAGRLVHRLVHNFPKLQCVDIEIPFYLFLTCGTDCKRRCSRLHGLYYESNYPLSQTSVGTRRFMGSRKRFSSLLRMLMERA